MAYKTMLKLSICSKEIEDELPIKEVQLYKHVELPIPPQIGIWLQDQCDTHNLMIETVAIHGQSLTAILSPIKIVERRVDEIILLLKENGWK